MHHTTSQNNSHLSHDEQAIVALCTPRGSGALALIRISGFNAVSVADALSRLASGKLLASAQTHTIHHGFIIDPTHENDIVDDVLFLLMRSPRTFTGQDTVEITCHNNQFIIERIIDLAIKNGARSAQPGEFTRRAYLQGKLDLLQAEAINELIASQSEMAVHKSMSMLQGSLSAEIKNIEEQLTRLLCIVEASFEFLDEEQRDLDYANNVCQQTQAVLTTIKEIKNQFAQQKQIKDGVRIALIGIVNVGKSTLFNALVGQDRAIVTDVAGTTRDSIEASIYKDGIFWLFIDTAGLRGTVDIIEQKGIERSLLEAEKADIVLLVLDASVPLDEQQYQYYRTIFQAHKNKIIIVLNKVDECDANGTLRHLDFAEGKQMMLVSAKQCLGIDELLGCVADNVNKQLSLHSAPFLLNQRQCNVLTELEVGLECIANSYSDGIHYEVVAYRVKDLLEKLSELTGKKVSEHVLDKVFGEFCIGK